MTRSRGLCWSILLDSIRGLNIVVGIELSKLFRRPQFLGCLLKKRQQRPGILRVVRSMHVSPRSTRT